MPTTFVNSKPEISCIYVNYRSAEFLLDSLQSLFLHETTVPFEVIVVNNDEQEKNTLEALQQKYPLHIIEAFHNPGFAASANKGAEEARGNILFFVNPDTKWQESFFQEAVQVLNNTPHLGALGIQLISPTGIFEGQNTGKHFSFLGIFQKNERSQEVDWLSGGALFVHKNIFQKLGGFDKQFFMYFEDMDFCLRLQKEGYQLKLHTEKKIMHLGGKSHRSKRIQKKIYDQSLYRYTKKHWPFYQHLLFHILHPCYRFFFPYGRN